MSDAAPGAAVEPDVGESRPPRRGTVITLTTVVLLILAIGFTILGTGMPENAVANFDATSWLWSAARSEVDRVNGVTGRVDTRAKVKDAQHHDLQISQTDRYLILHDLTTGQVSALDLTTLQVSAVMPTTPGLGVSVALHGDAAFVVDAVQGQVRQLDPRTLSPIGDAITLPPGIVAGGFDGKGTLWVAVPSEGTVVAIRPALVGGDGGATASPTVARTVSVTQPGHDLELSVLDEGVAVLDNTIHALLKVKGDKVSGISVPIDKPAQLPSRTTGSAVPVTVVEDRRVVVLDDKTAHDFTVPGSGSLSPAVAFAGRVYCADAATGVIYEHDSTGRLIREIRINAAGGPIELEVREDHLFINAPDGSTARVVNQRYEVKEVDKYAEGVLGDDRPPPPPPQQKPPTPKKPVAQPPGKPEDVRASAGDASARVTWRKARDNGSPITKYVVEGGGQTITVGANQRTVTIRGLTNGETYRFTVHAVNAKGAGPKATSQPVTPSSEVPDPPEAVTATANPDGTVTVTWPQANGQGRKVRSYQVTAVTEGAQTPVGEVRDTEMTIPAGTFPYGTQVAFTVVTINDLNDGSDPSEPSNTVVPFTTPGPPRNLTASTVSNQRGTIQVSWQPAEANGRPIEKYVVSAGDAEQELTGTSITLTGLPDDQAVQVRVRAVNEAGDGPDATATARTIGVPTVTLQPAGPTAYNSVSVTFTPNNKFGAATCRLQISGGGSAQTACTTTPVTLTVNGLWPNRTYSFTVTVTNAAGTATATGTRQTTAMRFTVICPKNTNGYCNAGIYAYRVPSQKNANQAINPPLRVGATGTPQCYAVATDGDVVNATPWGGKNSNVWLRFSYSGTTAYFPWAWARLDGGDNYRMLPPC